MDAGALIWFAAGFIGVFLIFPSWVSDVSNQQGWEVAITLFCVLFFASLGILMLAAGVIKFAMNGWKLEK